MDLYAYIRDITDFPTKGVVFKDITTLLKDPSALRYAQAQLLELSEGLKVDKVVAMESRGFFFGVQLAQQLNAGFVPIRKSGKLPGPVARYEYTLEYGTDVLEIHRDAIQQGDRILLHDDVLATGGTAAAAISLIEELGGTVVQCNFLVELLFLEGSKKLGGLEIRSLLQYI